ncbi:MAG: polyhydroxyalkanoate synthesis repressor PhaR [Beijerinckiaceae bacterium]|nr:polyhydroxyalkanoate synthesis repressor PhaR [Beijerinckiaceae bacterium]
MANENEPVIIKKYANRRLYNTGSSTYVTLEDLGRMVKDGQDFVVTDAKSGDNITRSVLTQIIFEQEAKEGQSLLPISFLRQLIGFYGDSMQMLVPGYLEMSLNSFVNEQQKMREQVKVALGGTLPGAQMFEALEEQTRKNIQMYTQALGVFNPFLAPSGAKAADAAAPAPAAAAETKTDLDDLKSQIADMQRKLEGLAKG